jgi:hypothetical protein
MTWTCSKCGESVEDSFDACWKCGTSWDGVADPDFTATTPAAAAAAIVPDADPTTIIDPIMCARCDQALEYVGRKRFHEGTNWGVLGELGELFVKRQHFDVYLCPRCGRVEFFVDGVGEAFRPH